MKKIISKNLIYSIMRNIIDEDECAAKGTIKGLSVGLEELYNKMVTNNKKIIKSNKIFKLDTMIFCTKKKSDILTFLEYIGYFNEGTMQMELYKNDEKIMSLESLDGEEIMIEMFTLN